ncbi:MAG TPA: hypothetical protein VI703_01730, partial [Anaerolineales bacterium]|nr:hypothetical protein [Anaerolineales bacterium]
MKPFHLSTLSLILILAACGPTAPAITPAPTDETGVGASTAVVVTVLPDPIGTPLPFFTPPPAPTSTPIPPLPSGLSPTELKYRVLDQYPAFFFCD